MHFKCMRPRMALSTLRCQVRNLNANTASGIMGASIGKACSCPSFLHSQIAITPGMPGFHGKKNQSSQHSGTLPPKVRAKRIELISSSA
jgi:hypothetical protein